MIKYYTILQKGILFKYWKYGTTAVVLVFAGIIYCLNSFNVSDYTNSALLSQKGNMAYNKNLWGDAGIFYSKAIENNTRPENIKYNLANSYYQQGRYKEAITLYENILDDKNVDFKAAVYNNLGIANYKKGALIASIEAFKSSIILDDKDNEVRRNLLFVYNQYILQLMRHPHPNKEGPKGPKGTDQQDNPNTNEEGDKVPDDQSSGKYQVSDKEMDRLLRISKQQELVPKGSKSKPIKSTDTHIDGPDY